MVVVVVAACCVHGAPDRVPAVVVGGIVPAAQPSSEWTVRWALLSYHSVANAVVPWCC